MKNSVSISAAEWRWAGGWTAAILLLSLVPYGLAILLTPAGWQFAGFLVNPLDAHSYIAKMAQGARGDWWFHLTYSPDPHEGALVYTFYLGLGHLVSFSGLSKTVMFHLARLLAGGALLLIAYRFIGRVTAHPAERRLAFLLLITASGLGWIGVILGAFPIDLWVPEAFVPYSLYTNPHFPLAMALMLLILDQALATVEISTAQPDSKLNWGRGVGAGVAALALAITSPFALIIVWAILFVFTGWRYLVSGRRLPWSLIWFSLGVGLFSGPVILYQYWVSVTNPAIAGWSAQNVTPAPSVLDVTLGYGLVGLLAVGGSWRVIRHISLNRPGPWLALLWAGTSLSLLYLPLALQRRLIFGLHIPLCILAALGLHGWLKQSGLKLRWRRLTQQMVIIVGALGTLFVWSIPLLALTQPPGESATTALLLLRPEEQAALTWLRRNVEPEAVILASPRLGMFVPGQTGARAFYGHPFETLQAETRQAQAEAFYRGELEAIPPLVDFVLYGPAEQALGRPDILNELPGVYSQGGVTIYQVHVDSRK